MSNEELGTLNLKWTVNTRPRTRQSNAFEFNGSRWELEFSPLSEVFLRRVSGACRGHPPFRISVKVLGARGGRDAVAVEGLSQLQSFARNQWAFKTAGVGVWWKELEELWAADPEFSRIPLLTFNVVLETEGDAAPQNAIEIEYIGESLPVASNVPHSQFLNTPCQESLVRDFSRMLEDQDSLTDVEFRFPGGELTRAHAVVVSARSSVMAAMLSSDMVEGRTRVVEIPNIEHGVFQHFLRYLYSGTLPELTVELALSLFEGGDQYAVLGLVQICTQYLRRNLTVQNACEVLVVADSHQHAELKEAVAQYMLANRVPRTSDRWRHFRQAHPMLAIEVLERLCPE